MQVHPDDDTSIARVLRVMAGAQERSLQEPAAPAALPSARFTRRRVCPRLTYSYAKPTCTADTLREIRFQLQGWESGTVDGEAVLSGIVQAIARSDRFGVDCPDERWS